MLRLVVFAAVVTLVAEPLAAQAEPRRFGLGMAFSSSGVGGGAGIYLPVALSPRRRLEPEISFFSGSSTFIISPGAVRESKVTSIELGVGLFFLADAGADTKVYLGPRMGLAWSRSRVTDPTFGNSDSEHTDWFLSAAAGGEHFLAERFSLGAEARLGYYHAGELRGSGGLSTGVTRFATGAAAFLHWYP